MTIKKLLAWSDLHQEFERFTPPTREDIAALGDVAGIVIAGDISSGDDFVDSLYRIARSTGLPVVAVLGNHEFYGWRMSQLRARIARELDQLREDNPEVDIRVLDPGVTELGGIRIIGATLWTDYKLGPYEQETHMALSQRAMTDFRLIKGEPIPQTLDSLSQPRDIEAKDFLEQHESQRAFISAALAKPHQGPTLVMTHHMPHVECIDPAYAGSLINSAFCSDLSEIFTQGGFHSWLYGHSHSGLNIDLPRGDRAVHLRTNPRGYPSETTAFDPLFTLDFNLT